jgi:outer membrane immunogenic protein
MLLAGTVAGSFAAPALAQDASPFTGPRIEGIIGYDALKSGDSDDDGVDTGENDGDESMEGALYGVGVGYDFDLGGLVAGVEGEFTESSGKQENDETLDIPFNSRIETGRDIYVGARLGFKATPTTLLYAKGGYTNTSIEAQFEGDDDQFEFDSNVDGWRVGAGVEQVLGQNMFGKLEYRYSNYTNLDFSDDFDLGDLDPENFDTDIDLDRHQVVAAFGVRF